MIISPVLAHHAVQSMDAEVNTDRQAKVTVTGDSGQVVTRTITDAAKVRQWVQITVASRATKADRVVRVRGVARITVKAVVKARTGAAVKAAKVNIVAAAKAKAGVTKAAAVKVRTGAAAKAIKDRIGAAVKATKVNIVAAAKAKAGVVAKAIKDRIGAAAKAAKVNIVAAAKVAVVKAALAVHRDNIMDAAHRVTSVQMTASRKKLMTI